MSPALTQRVEEEEHKGDGVVAPLTAHVAEETAKNRVQILEIKNQSSNRSRRLKVSRCSAVFSSSCWKKMYFQFFRHEKECVWKKVWKKTLSHSAFVVHSRNDKFLSLNGRYLSHHFLVVPISEHGLISCASGFLLDAREDGRPDHLKWTDTPRSGKRCLSKNQQDWDSGGVFSGKRRLSKIRQGHHVSGVFIGKRRLTWANSDASTHQIIRIQSPTANWTWINTQFILPSDFFHYYGQVIIR